MSCQEPMKGAPGHVYTVFTVLAPPTMCLYFIQHSNVIAHVAYSNKHHWTSNNNN